MRGAAKLIRSRAWRLLPLLAALILAACAGPSSNGNAVTQNAGFAATGPNYAPTRYYPPPGPPDDPWGPYINEAAARFTVPAQWIRAVMAQESGGEEQAVSPVGAICLMQVMPDTYLELQAAYGLGDDPFDPHNNILAGAAYIKEMFDKYGAPGFLAAYNAGPDRLDEFLAGTADLLDETVNYLADVTPNLGNAVAFTGPLANYASAAPVGAAPDAADFATGCDPDAAYDPDHPCAPAQIVSAGAAPAASAGSCDADRAYDPDSPCSSGTGAAGTCDSDLAYDPDNPCTPAAPAEPPGVVAASYTPPVARPPPATPQNWAIQVGAFASPDRRPHRRPTRPSRGARPASQRHRRRAGNRPARQPGPLPRPPYQPARQRRHRILRPPRAIAVAVRRGSATDVSRSSFCEQKEAKKLLNFARGRWPRQRPKPGSQKFFGPFFPKKDNFLPNHVTRCRCAAPS